MPRMSVDEAAQSAQWPAMLNEAAQLRGVRPRHTQLEGRALRRVGSPPGGVTVAVSAPSALLAAIADPRRGFDAIVAASTSGPSTATNSCTSPRCFDQHEAQLCLPETHGPVNVGDPSHRA